jgi:hypothetical protein
VAAHCEQDEEAKETLARGLFLNGVTPSLAAIQRQIPAGVAILDRA